VILDTNQRNLSIHPDLSAVSLSFPEPFRNVAALRILKVQITRSGGITADADSSIYMSINDYPNITTATEKGDVNNRPYFAWFNQAVEIYPPVTDNIYHDPHAFIFTPAEPVLQRINMRFFNYDHTPLASGDTRVVIQLAVYQHVNLKTTR
jgi:hypothetical protein